MNSTKIIIVTDLLIIGYLITGYYYLLIIGYLIILVFGHLNCLPYLFKNSNTLRKHAYSNVLKILQPKKEKFRIKNSDIFHIPAKNIDCGYSLEPPQRDGSNEYPQSMFF